MIDIWCQHYGIQPSAVLATRLNVTPEGLIAGWDQNKLIHVRNKRERGHGELSALKAQRPHIILVGDSLDDANMVEGDAALRTRIYDPRPDEKDSEAAQQATLRRFDLMLVGGTLRPLVGLMESMVQ